MATEDETDVVLSDVDDEEDPHPKPTTDPSQDNKITQLIAELDRERQARIIAETSKSELQTSFTRLKSLAHEAIKKRDEAVREKDRVLKEKEEMGGELERVRREREELGKEKEAAAQMMVTGIEKISGKVRGVMGVGEFGGLPRSGKYSGLPAVVYGVVKRTNEIVEAMLEAVEGVRKERDEAREAVEVRNYEIAIEVSELEARIGKLSEEVVRLEGERAELRKELEAGREAVGGVLGLVGRVHGEMCGVVRFVVDEEVEKSELLCEGVFVAREVGLEERVRAAVEGLEVVYEMSKVVGERVKGVVEEKSREVKSLNETVARLVREKEHVGVLLRSALSKRVSGGEMGREVFKVAENGLREAGIEYEFRSVEVEDGKSGGGGQGKKDDEIYALAGALENIIKESQLQIIELQHLVEELRYISMSMDSGIL